MDPRSSLTSNSQEFEDAILGLNKQAMDLMAQNKYDKALEILKSTKDSLKAVDPPDVLTTTLLGITYNNLGCYYKRVHRPNVALNYLQLALSIEIKVKQDPINIAGTHLNLWAILSQIKKHGHALRNAKSALKMLNLEENNGTPGQNLLTTKIIANYNIACEYEHLQQFPNAVSSYQVALELAEDHLPADHPLTANVRKSLDSWNKKLASVRQLTATRQGRRAASRVSPHLVSNKKPNFAKRPLSNNLRLPPVRYVSPGPANRAKSQSRRHRGHSTTPRIYDPNSKYM